MVVAIVVVVVVAVVKGGEGSSMNIFSVTLKDDNNVKEPRDKHHQ